MINPRMLLLSIGKRKQTFKFSILTTGLNETFTLPLLLGTHNFTVSWGDGTADNTITTYDDVDRIHTYVNAGTYEISMQGTCTGFAFNNGGDKLKIIQLLDFVDMGFITLNFYGCNNLVSISSSMSNLKSLTTAAYMFADCYELISIPTGIFSGSTGITSFERAFSNCSRLVSLPTDLFRYNINVTTFRELCYFCFRLPSLPENLFKYNLLATDFNSTFYDCYLCQYNQNIFYAPGEESTRFLNKTISFEKCFKRSEFTGIQGTAPNLWDCDFGTGVVTKAACFGGRGNSLTSLDNYDSIPSAWL